MFEQKKILHPLVFFCMSRYLVVYIESLCIFFFMKTHHTFTIHLYDFMKCHRWFWYIEDIEYLSMYIYEHDIEKESLEKKFYISYFLKDRYYQSVIKFKKKKCMGVWWLTILYVWLHHYFLFWNMIFMLIQPQISSIFLYILPCH